MTAWVAASTALLGLFGVAAAAAVRSGLLDRQVALQVTQVLVVLFALTASVAADRAAYLDLAILAAVAVFASSLAHARVAERWW